MGISEVWDDSFGGWLDAVCQHRPVNLDVNSGNPVGVGVIQVTAKGGKRVSASTAFLSPKPANLTIMTATAVEKIHFEDNKACCVEICGKKSTFLLSSVPDYEFKVESRV